MRLANPPLPGRLLRRAANEVRPLVPSSSRMEGGPPGVEAGAAGEADRGGAGRDVPGSSTTMRMVRPSRRVRLLTEGSKNTSRIPSSRRVRESRLELRLRD